MSERQKIEYGDFQTPHALAVQVVNLLAQKKCLTPSLIVEPTCGLGSFVLAAMQAFQNIPCYAFDINAQYVQRLRDALANMDTNENVHMICQDFFTCDWSAFFKELHQGDILIIGNPPWVTNAALGVLNSPNLPVKTNVHGHTGLEAKTGKANFDIAEWMLIRLIESLQGQTAWVAMLCKMATARKVLHYAWQKRLTVSQTSLHRIEAQTHFGVSVEACLFLTAIGHGTPATHATLYNGLNFTDQHSQFGLDHHELIANLEEYHQFKAFRGTSPYTWRSGLKHDAANVMELTKDGHAFTNGFGETVDLESACAFPLLKSSDIGNQRLIPRKYVIVTQTSLGERTESLQTSAPKTWAYLLKYAHILDGRKSSIYRQQPRFAIFGIGAYSFAPWKVAVSGLYKTIRFVVIGMVAEQPIMVDDTCYCMSCATHAEAEFLTHLLNSEVCQRFLQSLIFFDAKRPITKDILQRIDLWEIARFYHREHEAATYWPACQPMW